MTRRDTHRRVGAAAAMLCGLTAIHCSAPSREVRSAPSGTVASPSSTPSAVHWDLPSVWVIPPGVEDCSPIGVGHEGSTRYIVVGGLRASLTGDHAMVSDDAFSTRIVGSAHAGSQWLFVAEDGTVARSDSFVGRLERMASLPGHVEFENESAGSGRLAVIVDGTLWSTTGGAPTVVDALPQGMVRDAVFTDATHGVALLANQSAYWTADGGASWQPVETHVPARSLERHGSLVYVGDHNASTTEQVRQDGTIALGPLGDPPYGFLSLADSEHDAVCRMMHDRYNHDEPLASQRSDGLVVTQSGRDIVGIDTIHVSAVFTLHDALPEGCVSYATVRGAHTVFTCEGGGGSVAFDVGPQHTLRSLGPIFGSLLLSADGSVAAYRGHCPDATTHRIGQAGGSTRACVIPLDAGSPPHELPAGGELRAVTSQGLLLDAREPSNEPRRLMFIPMDAGPAREAFRVQAGRTVSDDQPTETDDGLLYWRMVPGDGTSPDETHTQPQAALVGTARDRFEARPLPSGASALGFLDSRRGIAADPANLRIWYTTDTGRTWTPASLPETAHYVDLPGTPTMDCDASKCVVGSSLRVVWGQHVGALPFTVLASDTSMAPPARQATPGLVMTCTGPATETPRPRLPAFFSAHDGNQFASDDAHDGVLADIAVRAGSGGNDHWQIVWRGSDPRGAFSSATRLVTLPRIAGANTELVDARSHGPQWGVALIGATRDTAVVLRCTPGHDAPLVCELLRGAAGHGIQSLGSHDPNAATSEPGDGLLDFVDSTRATVRLVRTINLTAQLETHDEHGHHTTSEPIPSYSGEQMMWPLARVHGTWGLAGERRQPPSSAWFFPFGGGRGLPTSLGLLTPRAVCRAPAPSDATVAIDASVVSVVGGGDLRLPPVRSDVVEVSSDGSCLRSVTVRSEEATAMLGAQPDGSLAGTLISAHGQRALRCTSQPSPAP